jgi:hypothetical protein
MLTSMLHQNVLRVLKAAACERGNDGYRMSAKTHPVGATPTTLSSALPERGAWKFMCFILLIIK